MAERKSSLERFAGILKKVDYLMIGSGIAVFVFLPGLGAAMVVGSAITLIPEEIIERRSKNKN